MREEEIFLSDKAVDLFGGGSVINRAIPSVLMRTIFSRPGQSQGLLYKQHCDSLIL